MKRSSIIVKALAFAMVSSVVFVSGCGSKKKAEVTTETTEQTTETTPMVTVPPTTTETTLQEYGMSIAPNDIQVTWKEDAMEAKVMYVSGIKSYLKVRKGPGTDDSKYPVVSKLPNGAEVMVVAKTDNGWYKTQEGFYVSSEFIKDTKPA
ncbi:MAG TPA: hypothetical protein DEG74_04735 [Clostridiales bacterium]|jgi:hypothetical protein|nr:SH3 domain-containing protein [Saccharofermentanaceae bacterium]HBY33052.1 hypothetical protein [Clostridiales bacterium]HBZ78656.1 hypothetical protein [Clostridiales bacterium]